MHPLITRARPAQARARHILDTALGALDITAPEVADHSAGKRRTPDATQRLHTLLTLADLAQAAPIRPAEPPSELAQRDATLGNHTP